jgi:HSP20 family protein
MLSPWFTQNDPIWKDMDRVRRELEQLFDLGTPVSNIRGVARGTFPAVNVGETTDDVKVFILAPGIDPAKIELTMEKNLLMVAAERDTERDIEKEKGPRQDAYHRRERFTGGFRRVISLPEGADPGKVEAKYADGILTVTIGKKEEEKARKINVAVA